MLPVYPQTPPSPFFSSCVCVFAVLSCCRTYVFSIADILGQIDMAIQYGEDAEPRMRDELEPVEEGEEGDGGDGI